MPIPKAKKKGGQLVFDEWTGDRIEENRLINQIRERIGRWRELGWPGVTPTTRALLEPSTREARERSGNDSITTLAGSEPDKKEVVRCQSFQPPPTWPITEA